MSGPWVRDGWLAQTGGGWGGGPADTGRRERNWAQGGVSGCASGGFGSRAECHTAGAVRCILIFGPSCVKRQRGGGDPWPPPSEPAWSCWALDSRLSCGVRCSSALGWDERSVEALVETVGLVPSPRGEVACRRTGGRCVRFRTKTTLQVEPGSGCTFARVGLLTPCLSRPSLFLCLIIRSARLWVPRIYVRNWPPGGRVGTSASN